MKFTEEKLEQVFTQLLGEQGFSHVLGSSISRDPDEVLIEADLKAFLLSRYEDDQLTENEARQIIQRLKSYPASELYESNKAFMKMLSDGFILKREDLSQKDLYIQLLDYAGLTVFRIPDAEQLPHIAAAGTNTYGKDRNIYKFVNQLEIVGFEKRIPDGILYINGLPLVVFEFKTAIRENCTIYDAFVQLTTCYKRDIPELFKYNAFCVLSDGVNNKAGSFFASYEFFYAWRRTLGEGNLGEGTLKFANNPNKTELAEAQGIDSLYTLVQGMLNKTTLRDIIRNFIYLPDSSRKDEKILCRYPQYYGANMLFHNIIEHQQPDGDGKGGTYFGATGSGKSFTMLFLSRLLMRSKLFSSPTILLITDRTDLDDQLAGQFTNAKGFIGDSNIISVESRAELRERLQGIKSGGVYLTTIHKFTEDTEILTDRSNVICISDEAHRSQTNLNQKVKVTSKGVFKTFGFAKYLHDSLPNATYVGFTGTPIDATLDVFGEIVDAYTMTESVEDEITVRIVYEGRAAKVLLNNSELQRIEDYYSRCADEGTNTYQIEESKKAVTNMDVILGDPDRLEALAKDFVKHYENRVIEGATVKGKAMFVCSSRLIAFEFYKNVINYLGSRSSSQEQAANTNYARYFTNNFGHPEEWHTRTVPHRNKRNLLQSITFRLADSLPQRVLQEIEEDIQYLSDDKKDVEKRKRYQYWLDQGLGCCALAHREMAQVVQEALQYHDGDKYDLLAWSIMPNHVHVFIRANADLPKIIQSWKSYTGKWALANNKKYSLGIEKEANAFWMPDYWDRFIRDEDHFNNTVRYILNNPVKAKLPPNHIAHLFKGVQLELHSTQKLHPTQINMVMTRGKDDPEELYNLLGTKEYRKELDRQFKDAQSNFKIAIVVDMWLTGFDVPFLDTIYIDKPIQRHNLIQTISRVNRKFKGKEKGLVVDYIGIKKQMNLALAQYNKADSKNFEDIKQSVVVVRDHLDLLAKIFYTFDSSKYFSGNPIEQLNTLNMAAEFVQVTEDLEKRFMFLVKRMKAAYDICSGSDSLSQDERDSIHFYLAVRSIVFKLTRGTAPDTAQMNVKVREMIKDALSSEGVEEIFKLNEDKNAETDIFDGDYLAKIEKIKLPNTKIKLLQQLLAKAIEQFKRVNRAQGIDFSKKMQNLVERYNERKESDVLRSEVLEDFTDEIIDLYHALREEKESFNELGIDFEEKAFYDILKALTIKYDFEYPHEKLLLLAKEVKRVVDDKAKYTDWSKRSDIKAELKVDLIILLAENNYPPIDRDEVYKEIFEQAENFKKYQN
jgi:HsdR family type I site-specific deoxyribonuclease